MTASKPASLAKRKHPRYYNGRFLTEKDFTAEHDYHRGSAQLINRMFRAGVVAIDGDEDSLRVGVNPEKKSEIWIWSGMALDNQGRQLVIPTTQTLDLSGWRSQTILVVIAYAEHTEENASYEPRNEQIMWVEDPAITSFPESSGLQEGMIVLARIMINENGEIFGSPEDRRQFIRPHRSTDSGWVRLPFMPRSFHGGEKENDFELLGTRARSPKGGADGCQEIPVPAGADEINQLKIAGTSSSEVRIRLECISANMSVNTLLEEKIQIMAGERTFTVGHRLGIDDALALIVEADGEAEIFFVAAEFD